MKRRRCQWWVRGRAATPVRTGVRRRGDRPTTRKEGRGEEVRGRAGGGKF